MTPYNMSFPVFVFVLPHVFVIVFVGQVPLAEYDLFWKNTFF